MVYIILLVHNFKICGYRYS